MFTAEQIQAASAKVTSGAEYPLFVRALKLMGVVTYEHFVVDGSTVYAGANQEQVRIMPPQVVTFTVNATSSATKLQEALKAHQQGMTNYSTFCQQAAEAGVEKWICNIQQHTISYVNTEGNTLLQETIPIG